MSCGDVDGEGNDPNWLVRTKRKYVRMDVGLDGFHQGEGFVKLNTMGPVQF